ncbi:MAG: CDP-glucose 4,6-dehydratase [Bdellovibrionota bacterium]
MNLNLLKGKKVLVTGHTGFKGSWLCHWLHEIGADVVGYSINVPTNPSHFEATGLSEIIKDIRGDILDLENLRKVFKSENPDVVFHLAARPIVRDCYENPKLAFETNVIGTLNILECLRDSKVKAAVLITSDKCYENVEWEYGYREIDRLGGADPYSASKACAEIVISSYFRSYFANHTCKIASVRAGNVIGGGDWADYRIVPDCVKSWSKNETLIVRSPNSTRPWQHVLEPLSGYLTLACTLLEDKKLAGESFNFGPNSDVVQPVGELIEEMNKTWKAGKFKIEIPADQKKEAGLLKLSCDKALFHLKWKAVMDFTETIAMTAQWYQQFYQSPKDAKSKSKSQIKEYINLAKERGLPWAN